MSALEWGKVHSCVLHDLSWHNLGVLSADISWGLLESQLKVPPNCFKQWPVKQYSIAFSADPAKLIYDHKEILFFTFWLIDFIYSYFLDLFPQQLAPSVSVVTSSPNSPNSPNNQQSFTVETGSDPNNGVQVKISVSQSQNQSQHQSSNSALLTKYILELLLQRKKTSTTGY